MMKTMCAGCGQVIDTVPPQPPVVVNRVGSTVIVIDHPKPFPCPQCGVELYLVVESLGGAILSTQLLPEQYKSSIIIPKGGLIA